MSELRERPRGPRCPRTAARRFAASLALLALVAPGACQPSGTGRADDGTPTTRVPPTGGDGGKGPKCDLAGLPFLEPGTLTVATDLPGQLPWMGRDPVTGEGFEGGLIYELADRLDIPGNDVTWLDAPYWDAFAQGEKPFDLFVGKMLVLPERETEGDLSLGYYRIDQAVIVRADSPAADARSLAELRRYRFGGLTGRTGLLVIDLLIAGPTRPYSYPGIETARQAIDSGEVDGLVLDHYVAPWLVDIDPQLKLLGRVVTGDEFALAMPTGSRLVPCVSEAIEAMRGDGTLRDLEREWLPSRKTIPILPRS